MRLTNILRNFKCLNNGAVSRIRILNFVNLDFLLFVKVTGLSLRNSEDAEVIFYLFLPFLWTKVRHEILFVFLKSLDSWRGNICFELLGNV